jgi:hypothetical protein
LAIVKIRRLILDVLKPRDPPIYMLASKLATCKGVNYASISLAEIDQQTETIKVTLEGKAIDISDVERCVEGLGASVQSFDEVKVTR